MIKKKTKVKIQRQRANKIFLQQKSLQIQATGSVELTAAQEDDAAPRFTMVAYSGGPMTPGGWFEAEPLVIDIKGIKYPGSGKIPIHRDHDQGKVVGHSTKIEAGKELRVSGVISADNEHAREVVANSKNQFPWQSSVGASLLAAPEFVAEGKRVRVNGRMLNGPIYVARRTQLFEASFVSLGADSSTSAVAAKKGKTMDPELRKWLEAKGFNPDELDDTMLAPLKAQYQAELDAQQHTEDDAGSTDDNQQQGIAAQQQQGDDDILAARRQLIADEIARESFIREKLGHSPELSAKATVEGWSNDRIELEALRSTAATSPAIHVQAQVHDRPEALEASLYMHGGVGTEEQAVRDYGEETVVVARRKCPRTPGLKYLIHEFLRANGDHSHAPGTFDDGTIRSALRLDNQLGIRASSGFSTISLSGTLSNLANKALINAFNAVPSVFRRFATTTGHSDFKTHTKYRVTTLGRLDKLGPTGEIVHTELDEETYTNIVETYARMIALTRVMMRNDDLDAFLRLPAGLGRISAETLEHSVFEQVTDNTSGFHSDSPAAPYEPNALAAGAGSALSVTSLGSAETLFWKQTNMDGKPINLRPSVLLVPPELYRDAQNIVNRTTVTVAGDPTTAEQLRVGNEYQGEFEPVQSPYVSAGTGGASATQWWLFAAPTRDVAAYEVAFLDNRQTPIIESAETDFNTLGMQWRSYYDWGVAEFERRALVYSPGA